MSQLTCFQMVLLLAAAVTAGALNAVAGGGSFISFPALLFVGVPPVIANATNAVALWPAGIASAIAYREHITQPKRVLFLLGAASLVGGAIGAGLLLLTSEVTFVFLLPWLLLVASALFTFSAPLMRRVRGGREPRRGPLAVAIGVVPQLIISIYGGYFGGGMGIMMMALWSVLGLTNIHEMNGLKGLLGTVINGVAVLAFVGAGAIAWAPGTIMVMGATAGAFAGASLAKRIDAKWVRRTVTLVAWGMTVLFFVKTYGRI